MTLDWDQYDDQERFEKFRRRPKPPMPTAGNKYHRESDSAERKRREIGRSGGMHLRRNRKQKFFFGEG